MVSLISDMVHGVVDRGLGMVRQTQSNVVQNQQTGALSLGSGVTRRRFGGRSAVPLSRVIAVLSVCHGLLQKQTFLSQRELYYLLIAHFKNQLELNVALQDACATLGVPRYALNICAATRGVVAGCIQIAPATSAAFIDGALVGCAGWPIPGNMAEVVGTQITSHANFIVVIEKVSSPRRRVEGSPSGAHTQVFTR